MGALTAVVNTLLALSWRVWSLPVELLLTALGLKRRCQACDTHNTAVIFTKQNTQQLHTNGAQHTPRTILNNSWQAVGPNQRNSFAGKVRGER